MLDCSWISWIALVLFWTLSDHVTWGPDGAGHWNTIIQRHLSF